jgi:hypothetical protein
MLVKSQYGIVRLVAVRRAPAQVSEQAVDAIALLTLFCKTGRRTAVDAVRNRFAGMCAMRTQARVNCARTGRKSGLKPAAQDAQERPTVSAVRGPIANGCSVLIPNCHKRVKL